MSDSPIYEKYKHLLAPKTQEVLEVSFDKESVEHRINRNTVVESRVMPLIVKVRDRFDQVEAIHRVCKELDHMVDAGVLAGSFKNSPLFYRPVQSVVQTNSPQDMWRAASYDQFADARFVGAQLHVFVKNLSEVRQWYDYDFCTFEGHTVPYYPREAGIKKCVCGIETLYGKAAMKQMHADWCPLSVY